MITVPSLATIASVPLKIIKDYPWQAGCAALAIACVWQHGRIVDWQERAAAEVAAHQATKAGYIEAQAEAAKLAEAARIKTEQRYAELAQEADNANEEADSWRARAQRFARSGGLSQGGTCSAGTTGDAGTGTESDASASSDGPGTVTLSRADFETLSDNTARLLKVHAWGEAMIAEGFAAPIEGEQHAIP